MRGLLLDYVDRLRDDDARPRPEGVWIFQAQVDHELYLQAACALLEDAETRGRLEGAEAAGAFEGADECACRCREHHRMACPLCLGVERCPVHMEDDPARISPRWRREDR